MTRTTATPSGSRFSTYSVLMPAAMQTTSAPGRSVSATSRSRPSMSCGLTTSTTVSADPVASALPVTSTPYFSASSAARSGRRSVTTRSPGSQPARSSPDSSVSPITPAPRTATRSRLPACSVTAQPLVARARRKNATLAGFSAIRRIR